jgi:hypothetical protein
VGSEQRHRPLYEQPTPVAVHEVPAAECWWLIRSTWASDDFCGSCDAYLEPDQFAIFRPRPRAHRCLACARRDKLQFRPATRRGRLEPSLAVDDLPEAA